MAVEEGGGELSGGLEGSNNDDTGSTPGAVKFHLRIHGTLQLCQSQNGLRHGSYQRYRQYCTRRLKRVRKSREVRHVYGKGRTFIAKPVTQETAKTTKHLLIPLMMAERAWSYAMQIKEDPANATGRNSSSSSGSSIPSRVAHHLERRLAKAVKWASDLETLCLAVADERTTVESQAYAAWMRGNLALEREKWADALKAFQTAYLICKQLGAVGSIEDQDIFTQRAAEIEPVVRYCKYNLQLQGIDVGDVVNGIGGGGGGGGGADGRSSVADSETREWSREGLLGSKLAAVLAEERKKQAKELDHISWRGKDIAVRSEDLREALVAASAAAAELKKNASETNFLRCFSAHDDAISKVTKEMSKLDVKSKEGNVIAAGPKMIAHRNELQALQMYVRHTKLGFMLRRNEALIKKMRAEGVETTTSTTTSMTNTGKDKEATGGAGSGGASFKKATAADIVHVYDALLQNVRDMRAALTARTEGDELEGGQGGRAGDDDDDADDVDMEEDDMLEVVSADQVRYRAARCYFMAEAYATDGKWLEALALYDHAKTLCSAANSAPGLEFGDGSRKADHQEITAAVEAGRCRVQAQALLIKIGQADGRCGGGGGAGGGGDDGGIGGGKGKKGSSKKGTGGNAATAGRPLLDRLSEFEDSASASRSQSGGASSKDGKPTKDLPKEEGGGGGGGLTVNLRVADFPPSLTPVAAKPLLLDAALHRLTFPELSARCGEVKAGEGGGGNRRASLKEWYNWALGR